MFSTSSPKESAGRSNAASVTGNGKSLAPPGVKAFMPAPLQPVKEMITPVVQGVFGQESATQVVEKLKKRYPGVITPIANKLVSDFAGLNDLDDVLDYIYDMMGKNQKLRKIKAGDARNFDIPGRLAAAQAAIAHAKSIFKWGAGNQLEAQHVSEGNAGERSNIAKAINPIRVAEMPSDHLIKSVNENAAAGLSRGGTCAQYAAVVFEYLKSTGKYQLTLVSKKDHTFVVIGDYSHETENTLVVADAWPSVAQALLFADHFSEGKGGMAVKTGFKPPDPSEGSDSDEDEPLPVSVKPASLRGKDLNAKNDRNFLAEATTELAPTGHKDLSLMHYAVGSDEDGYSMLDNLGIHFDNLG
ncbi:hypothetical protein [Sediminibacterium ginsengisoli]|uniref:Uncharacterized protein n=1 Tax=Sediminibacterium ginsengisoli TaxID=413434 RepID=A0A1T4PYN9_9BACT|nr:hypothetical protein [Sediminibacterium ginsengisoli]SJZ96662.1 hypothetical protein SAMN04488132_10743 [Sediminibacterium ginsengisoli]